MKHNRDENYLKKRRVSKQPFSTKAEPENRRALKQIQESINYNHYEGDKTVSGSNLLTL